MQAKWLELLVSRRQTALNLLTLNWCELQQLVSSFELDKKMAVVVDALRTWNLVDLLARLVWEANGLVVACDETVEVRTSLLKFSNILYGVLGFWGDRKSVV